MPINFACTNVDGGFCRLGTDFEHFIGMCIDAVRRLAGLGAPHLSICRERDTDWQLDADEVTAVMRYYIHRRTWLRGSFNKHGTFCLQYEVEVLPSVVPLHARGCWWKAHYLHICFVV